MTSLREAVDEVGKHWEFADKSTTALVPGDRYFLFTDAARTLLSIREAAVYVSWCETHGDMSAGLYGFRIDVHTCWAFTQIDWSLHADATDCSFVPVAVVPAGLIGGETE